LCCRIKEEPVAEFSVLKESEAPRRSKTAGRLSARMREYEGFVAGVKKGQVGRLAPASGESPRGVALRVSRAGKRIGRDVNAWVVDGTVYFSVR
jgi:hypothetical protein